MVASLTNQNRRHTEDVQLLRIDEMTEFITDH